MLKGKKNTTGVVRPESPGSRRRRSLRRTTMPARRIQSSSRTSLDVNLQYSYNFPKNEIQSSSLDVNIQILIIIKKINV